MSADDPLEAQTQPLSGGTDPSKQSKKKKKKKKKKGRRSIDKTSRSSRINPKSYGNGPRFSRRESIPHHATVQSLACINQPIVVNQLTKISQDLKYHRELQKALMELKQKDEDYRYAVEIGESLTKENEYLKDQIEVAENIWMEKNQILTDLVSEYTMKYERIEAKNQLLISQNQYDEEQIISKDNISIKEKHILQKQLEKEKQRHLEDQQMIDNLMKKADDLKKKYDALKKSNNELKQIAKTELAQHIQMQKSIEAEAIYLAARKANLEEEREDLLNLLDQRDYEITMLNQQLSLQRKQAARNTDIQQMQTLGDDIPNTDGDGSDEDEYYQHYHDENDEYDESQQMALSDEDEIDIIAEILDDEDIFEQELYDDDDDKEEDDVNIKKINDESNAMVQALRKQICSLKKELQQKHDKERGKDSKVFDKIKEYLHLTASAVKIKYPTVRNIQSDELIKRVKELPFYKYQDQMVRIMETEIKKVRDAEKMKNRGGNAVKFKSDDVPPPIMQKRRSFLSIFNIFGDVENGGMSDDESDKGSDNKSNEGSDDNEEHNSGITDRRKRRHSHSRKKKRSFKKRKHRKSLSKTDNDNDMNDMNDNNEQQGVARYRRGVSVQASAVRLKNT